MIYVDVEIVPTDTCLSHWVDLLSNQDFLFVGAPFLGYTSMFLSWYLTFLPLIRKMKLRHLSQNENESGGASDIHWRKASDD